MKHGLRMRESVTEIIVGALVVAIAASFLTFAINNGGNSSGKTSNSYKLTARFNKADGLSSGSDVRVSGIKVGVVTSVKLEPETYLARLNLSLDQSVLLPVDSVARVSSDSLLGGSHLALEPGVEADFLDEGDEIEFTRGSVDLLTLFGGLLGGSGANNSGTK